MVLAVSPVATGEYKSHSLEISNLSDLPAVAIAHVVSKVCAVVERRAREGLCSKRLKAVAKCFASKKERSEKCAKPEFANIWRSQISAFLCLTVVESHTRGKSACR